MHPEWTPAVARALDAARGYAFQEQSAEVLPLHLFLGLIDEEEGKAAELLARAGLLLGRLRRPRATAPDTALPPFSEDAHAILSLARLVARNHEGESVVTGSALLHALLQYDENLRRSLQAEGLEFERLELAIRASGEPPLEPHEPLQLNESTDLVDAARILDANFNRAREALRVVEDYCRFVLDDKFLSGELKHIRHDLVAALAAIPSAWLLQGRETLRDVGTSITTTREGERHTPLEVAQINFKRLEEALRSLEEFGKLRAPNLGRALEALRYRAYTIERALVSGAGSRQLLADARLYVLLTGSLCTAALDWTIQEAAAGGAGVFQLREKELDDRRLLERAHQMRRWTRQAGVLFILNDRPDLARLSGADGVHLGQDDLPVKEARRILGPDGLIGISTHTIEQVRQAVLDGANYIGIGPAFSSTTKVFDQVAGLEFVRQALAETSLPAFVIGGVNHDSIGAIAACGARRVAVSAAICRSEEPRTAAADLMRHLKAPPSGD